MKKEYISPSINIVKVQPRLLQSASPVENGYDPNNPTGTTGSTSGNLSRRNGWGYDDEEEDDF